MPTVYVGNGWKITMYFGDHNPPHFHVVTADGEAKIRISDLSLMRGRISARVLKDVRKWAAGNRALLETAWKECSE